MGVLGFRLYSSRKNDRPGGREGGTGFAYLDK